MGECISCGTLNQVMCEIRPGSWLCYQNCYDEYMQGYIALQECELCKKPFITADADLPPPHICIKCEHSKINKNTTYGICIRRAINIFVADRQREDPKTRAQRAKDYFKWSLGLAPDTIVVGKMRAAAFDANIPLLDFIKDLANLDVVREAVDQLVFLNRESAYKAYDALEDDSECKKHNIKSSFYKTYLALNDESICLEIDDPLSYLPF